METYGVFIFTSQGYTRIINLTILIIVMNRRRLRISNTLRKILHIFIKLCFVNSFIANLPRLHTRKCPILTFIVCKNDLSTTDFFTNSNNICLFNSLNKAITYNFANFFIHLIVNVRERSANTSKSFRYSLIALLFNTTTIRINGLNLEAWSGPLTILISSITTKRLRNFAAKRIKLITRYCIRGDCRNVSVLK
ncbi:Uncharacterised protein [Candidatus Bartonella washoeensis]|nr:Uncharacterised protein [Bartonella washoeensis]